MKALFALAAASLLAGCAANGNNQQLAQADCKVHPITTASAAGVRKPTTSSIEQRDAEMQLASSEYRMRNLRQNSPNMNNVEDALRDCNMQ